jgi:hypothetical protein
MRVLTQPPTERKPTEQMPRRKGGQAGNVNALRHGKYSARLKAERWAAGQAERDEAKRKEAAWLTAAPKVDYASRIAELIRLRAEQEAADRD